MRVATQRGHEMDARDFDLPQKQRFQGEGPPAPPSASSLDRLTASAIGRGRVIASVTRAMNRRHSGLRTLLLGAGIVVFGAIALFHLAIVLRLELWQHRWEPLAYFLVSSAITIGLVIFAIRTRKRPPDRRSI